MADITVETATASSIHLRINRPGPVWIDLDIGYVFYVDGAGTDLVYRKTTDKGATWGNKVVINSAAVTMNTIWFDKWTPGDSGTLIHIWYISLTDKKLYYRSLDVSDDSLGTERTLHTTSAGLSVSLNNSFISGSKAIGGNLYIVSWVGIFDRLLHRSVDAGANWTSRTNGGDGTGPDHMALFPDGTSADNEDMVMIYWDKSASEISLKKYDDSANSWAETSISSSMDADDLAILNMSAVIRHSDGHILLAAWSEIDTATADLRFWDINPTTPTITAKANVLTNALDCQQCAVFIDQNTNKITVYYLGDEDGSGTWLDTVNVNSKVSEDGGGTWGSETAYSEATADDIRGVWAGHSTPGAAAGRSEAIFSNLDLGDLFVNVVNSVELGADPDLSLEAVAAIQMPVVMAPIPAQVVGY